MNFTPESLLPLDESVPRERPSRKRNIAIACFAIVIHAIVPAVFVPRAMSDLTNGATADHAADRTTLFLSGKTMSSYSALVNEAVIKDPRSFLHPPERLGFSMFLIHPESQENSDSDSFPLLEPLFPSVKKPEGPAPSKGTTRLMSMVLPDEEAEPAEPIRYPFWSSDSNSGEILFPPFSLDVVCMRILERERPEIPDVFQIKAPALPDLPYEAVLIQSCGEKQLDVAALQYLDTFLNSENAPESLRKDGVRCRVVWTSAVLEKVINKP